MPVIKDDDEERKQRIDHILEELRLNTEDMQELVKQATERAVESARAARRTVAKSRELRACRLAAKKL